MSWLMAIPAVASALGGSPSAMPSNTIVQSPQTILASDTNLPALMQAINSPVTGPGIQYARQAAPMPVYSGGQVQTASGAGIGLPALLLLVGGVAVVFMLKGRK